MNNTLLVRNRQRRQPIDCRRLERILRALLVELMRIDSFELALYVVAAPEMTRLNETYLRHAGSTDVLAFDYTEPAGQPSLRGEIFVCVDEAKLQATRYDTTWQSELVRYMIHGLLHLRGYDDHHSASRRRMKQQENRLLKALTRSFDLAFEK